MKQIVSLGTLAFGVAIASAGNQPNYVSGELIVRYRQGSYVAAQLAHRMAGVAVLSTTPQIQVDVIQVRPGTEAAALRAYKRNPAFISAERNVYVTWHFTPNDPLYSQQWGPQKMNVPLVWDFYRGDPAVKVAVLDDGVPRNHPDLAGKILPGKDYIDGDDDPDPGPDGYHGTHVAGIVAANTNNGIGVAGTGYNIRVVPVRFNTLAESIDANVWVADQGVKVTNMSYGFPFLATSDAHAAATTYAWNKGVLLVAAAGNSNNNKVSVPQSDPAVVVIGASTPQDTKASFSSYGDWVDLAAPGTSILSTVVDGGYEAWDGTSMASPGAAGVAGLLFSAGGASVNNRIVRDAMFATAKPIGNWVVRGRIDAARALSVLPIGRDVTYPATSIAMVTGSEWVGGLQDVQATDGRYFKVSSIKDGTNGVIASAEVHFEVDDAVADINKFVLDVRANGPATSTNFLFLWNYTTGKWDLIRAFYLRTTGSTPNLIEVAKANLPNYVRNSEVRLVSRALVPNRMRAANFVYSLDKVEVNAVVK